MWANERKYDILNKKRGVAMREYIFCPEINREICKSIRMDFKYFFNVDLNNTKYDEYKNISDKWNAIVKDAFPICSKNDKEYYVKDFVVKLHKVVYGTQEEIIRPHSNVIERRDKDVLELRKSIKKLMQLVDDYTMYDSDVWMNVYLSILYIKETNQKYAFPGKEKTGLGLDIDNGIVMAKGLKYQIPFKKYQEGFCEGYINKVIGKDDVQILGAYLTEGEGIEYKECNHVRFRGYRKRAEMTLKKDVRYQRWSREHVQKLENYKYFKAEDKALFHKTINGILIRNLTDTMISTEMMSDAEDYLFLVDKLCTSKSLNWQNLIGCVYIMAKQYEQTLVALDLWCEMHILFELWFMLIDVMNRRLELLTKAVLYLKLKEDRYFSDLEELEINCKKSLEKVERNPIPYSQREKELIYKEWSCPSNEMRMRRHVINNHRNYCWVYAILQRQVIVSMTSENREKIVKSDMEWNFFKEEEWKYKIDKENSVVKKLEEETWKAQNRIDRLITKLGGYQEIIGICKRLRIEHKTTTDLLDEIQKRLKGLVPDDEIVDISKLIFDRISNFLKEVQSRCRNKNDTLEGKQ